MCQDSSNNATTGLEYCRVAPVAPKERAAVFSRLCPRQDAASYHVAQERLRGETSDIDGVSFYRS